MTQNERDQLLILRVLDAIENDRFSPVLREEYRLRLLKIARSNAETKEPTAIGLLAAFSAAGIAIILGHPAVGMRPSTCKTAGWDLQTEK